MDLEQAVWVFDTAYRVMRPDEKRAWDIIRKVLVDKQNTFCKHDNTSQVIVCLDCGEELSSST